MSIPANRIQLRQLTMNDREFVFRLYNTEGFLRFVGDRNLKSLDDADLYLENTLIPMYAGPDMGLKGIYHVGADTYIGVCGLVQRDFLDAPDLGFGMLPEFEGRGYAREASELILNQVKKAGVYSFLYAICLESNVRSITLLDKLGFQFLETIIKDGERVNKYKLEWS